MPPLTEEQKTLRARGIGASEIAAVCGIHPHMKPIDVYCRKTGDAPDDFDGNAATDWGNMLEPLLARWYEQEMGIKLVPGTTVRNAEHPICIATPDFVHEDGSCLVQAKSVGMHVAWHWGADDVAEYVLLQEIWECLATGIRKARVVASIGGLAPTIYDVEYSHERAEKMLAIAERFWDNYVATRTPPPPDGSDAYKDFLARRFPKSSGSPLPATDEVIELAAYYDNLRSAMNADEERQKEVANRLKSLCGDGEGFWWDGGKVTWKTTKKGNRTLDVRLKDNSKRRAA